MDGLGKTVQPNTSSKYYWDTLVTQQQLSDQAALSLTTSLKPQRFQNGLFIKSVLMSNAELILLGGLLFFKGGMVRISYLSAIMPVL